MSFSKGFQQWSKHLDPASFLDEFVKRLPNSKNKNPLSFHHGCPRDFTKCQKCQKKNSYKNSLNFTKSHLDPKFQPPFGSIPVACPTRSSSAWSPEKWHPLGIRPRWLLRRKHRNFHGLEWPGSRQIQTIYYRVYLCNNCKMNILFKFIKSNNQNKFIISKVHEATRTMCILHWFYIHYCRIEYRLIRCIP